MGIREIARRAGVSPSTVSLALQNSPRLAAATRTRVQAVARQAGHRPNPRLAAAMKELRASRLTGSQACFGIVSFYDTPRPWERLPHLPAIHEAMRARAGELGYRLEPIWLRAPGMTHRRVRAILKARGIQGLLCFGSPDFDQEFPAELDDFATVTIGQSIRTPLHRVTSHFFLDTWRALDRVRGLGYGRPGLILGNYEDVRSGHACAGAYHGWCAQHLGSASALRVLRMDRVEPAPLAQWLASERPDSLVFVHLTEAVAGLHAALLALGLRAPGDIGVAVVSQIIGHPAYSGMQQNQHLMGTWAVELLADRIANRDLGIPAHPRVELVESEWVPGKSLRRRRGSPMVGRVHSP